MSGKHVMKGYELGRHMAKLTVGDANATIILRPSRHLSSDNMNHLYKDIQRWKEATGTKLSVLLVPHNLEVFVVDGKTTEERDAEDVADRVAGGGADGMPGGDAEGTGDAESGAAP